jgi:carbonic anhydrase
MNISMQNITGKCDSKCSYDFKYTESNSTAKNNGVLITLTYESTNASPVSYNGEKYNVSSIMISSPSVHRFNNEKTQCEMIIEHVPVKGGNNLNVCIPFVSSSETSTASKSITEIIEKVAANAPSEGDSTNLNISNFNLQNIVPRKPFFAYSSKGTDNIVFGILEAIPLSSRTIKTLQQIIKPYLLNIPEVPLFYNSSGPLAGTKIGDGIYISCQPTGSSKEYTPVQYDKNVSTIKFSSMFTSEIFIYIIMTIVLLLVFFGISLFYSYLLKDTPKPSFMTS